MESIGPYRVLAEIARGGMGIVYRAADSQLQREVAIKVLLSAHADENDVRRFREEAKATARLRHPSIVGIQSAGLVSARPYLVMDLVQGESLLDRLKKRMTLEPREAAEITRRLAEALHYAHNHGVIHRDIKPANILIDRDETPMLTDFGMARILGRDERITLSGEVIGTPYYMSPEQASGYLDQIGPLSDVYSLGATLYEMLTGHPPFRGDSVISTLDSVITGTATPISDLRPGVDDALKAICRRCMEKKAEDRYPSARALAEDLARYLLLEDQAARPGNVPLRVGLFVGGLAAGALLTGVLLPRKQTPPTPQPKEAEPRPALDLAAETARIETEVTLRVAKQLPRRNKAAALQILDRAIRKRPTARVHAQRALARLVTGDKDGALADCRKALELDGRCHQAHVARAAVLTGRKRHREALEAIAAALEIEPKSARAFAYRGVIHRELRNSPAALEAFDKALELDPKRAKTWLDRGTLFHSQGKRHEALENYDRALKLDPNLSGLHSLRGRAYMYLGEHQRAQEAFTRSLDLNPTDADTYLWRGKLYRKMGEKRRELADFERAVLLRPERALWIVERGVARENNDDVKGALADYTRAIGLAPKNGVAYFNRGRLRLSTNDPTGALADLRKARKLFPRKHPLSARIRRTILELERRGD